MSINAPESQFGFSFDQKRCTGCRTCVIACKDYHDLGPGIMFRTVHEYAAGAWRLNEEGAWEQDVTAFYVSLSCSHCANPVCLRICTAGAVLKDARGFVTIDHEACTGCQLCAVACPYHAPRFDEASGRVEKCDGCSARIAQGRAPVCVEACPQHALGFGLYDDLSAGPRVVERIAAMPDPVITQPNYAIEPSEAVRGVGLDEELMNPREV